jgi:cobalamin biosynthesis Mg chelatase CobN
MRNVIIILLLSLVSCGTRNVSKTETKTEIATKDTTSVVINSGTVTKAEEKSTKEEATNTEWNFESGTATPIDPNKPMTHTDSEGKTTTWTNANVNFSKGSGKAESKSTEKSEVKTETKDTTQVKSNTGSQTAIKQSGKTFNSEREGAVVNIKFWIGAAIATAIILWVLWFLFWKRRKK